LPRRWRFSIGDLVTGQTITASTDGPRALVLTQFWGTVLADWTPGAELERANHPQRFLMKTITAAFAALLLLAGSALAANTDGTIKAVDKAARTLTLDDGSKYKLSDEYDLEQYTDGMSVTIQYEEVNGTKVVLQIIPD
jgi:hypothetical protein